MAQLAVDETPELAQDLQLLRLLGRESIVERADSAEQPLALRLPLVRGPQLANEGGHLVAALDGQRESAGDPVAEGPVELVHQRDAAIELGVGAGQVSQVGLERLVGEIAPGPQRGTDEEQRRHGEDRAAAGRQGALEPPDGPRLGANAKPSPALDQREGGRKHGVGRDPAERHPHAADDPEVPKATKRRHGEGEIGGAGRQRRGRRRPHGPGPGDLQRTLDGMAMPTFLEIPAEIDDPEVDPVADDDRGEKRAGDVEVADGELGEGEGDQRPDRERPAEREHPRQRTKIEEQRRQHRRQGEQRGDGHAGDEAMLLGQAADDVAGHPHGDAGAGGGGDLGGGGVDLPLERVRQPGAAVEIAAVEVGANDDQLEVAVAGDQRLRMGGLLPGLVQFVAKPGQAIAPASSVIAGGRVVGLVERDVEGVGLHHAVAQGVARRGEVGQVREQEPVVPGVAAKDAVVGGDAADAQRLGVERPDPPQQHLARAGARGDIRALHAEHEGGGDAGPLLERPQLAHRGGRLGQKVREIALHAQPAGQHRGGDRHGCRHDQDGSPAFPRITISHWTMSLGAKRAGTPVAPVCSRQIRHGNGSGNPPATLQAAGTARSTRLSSGRWPTLSWRAPRRCSPS